MRRTLFCLLFGALLIGGLTFSSFAAPRVFAASHVHASIPGCADWDYSCGYLHGFADGRSAANNGLCHTLFFAYASTTPSQQGYRDAFRDYCP
ncbi:hypothetical protein [Dictyobacter arantiisoli]|uniref:Uncharacterized protein n=1 Tax=Dictyobacter arantiisoli TaxID=2014874 RepID=A0A5A5TAX1_9CHLR|nr:hypothetical protein [Dictyobacter arantiisoli]GCF08631.1 hypothetical protein KDI_21950 [Dictyobacter arantiisoli]